MRPIDAALPGLDLPCLDFAQLPTPVQSHHFDGREIWVKRDDLSHPDYGGNKVRKLEFILADAKARGVRRIVTFGATGTHHGLATALFCQQQGLECEILLFDQPDSPHVQENLRLLQKLATKLRYCGSLTNTLGRYYLHPRRVRGDTSFLFAGGSNHLGVLAFINAALELKQQVDEGLLPEPAVIYCPVGSSSTLAGLTLGVALAGLNSEVRGVRVADSHVGPFEACTVKSVQALMHQTLKYLKKQGLAWSAGCPSPILLDDWIGDGYGHPTLEAGQAMSRFQAGTQLSLDMTYTAKCFAAVLADQSKEPVLYWHTLSSVQPQL